MVSEFKPSINNHWLVCVHFVRPSSRLKLNEIQPMPVHISNAMSSAFLGEVYIATAFLWEVYIGYIHILSVGKINIPLRVAGLCFIFNVFLSLWLSLKTTTKLVLFWINCTLNLLDRQILN